MPQKTIQWKQQLSRDQFTVKSRNSHFISHYEHLIGLFFFALSLSLSTLCSRFGEFFVSTNLFFLHCFSVQCLRIAWNLLYDALCVSASNGTWDGFSKSSGWFAFSSTQAPMQTIAMWFSEWTRKKREGERKGHPQQTEQSNDSFEWQAHRSLIYLIMCRFISSNDHKAHVFDAFSIIANKMHTNQLE